jgi:ribosomal protein S19E (S16A)
VLPAIFEGSSVMGLVLSTDFKAEEPLHDPPSNKHIVRNRLDNLEDYGFVEYSNAGEEASPKEEAYACRADSKSVQ